MNKDWEELSESLALELKKEIAESYYREKAYLEERWNLIKEDYEQVKKKYRRVFNNVWRINFLLNKDGRLIEIFERLTQVPVLTLCETSKKVFPLSFNIPETELKKKIFNIFVSPFAFTSKRKFVKLFVEVYKRLKRVTEEYNKELEKITNLYKTMEEETEDFYKRFDLSYILDFFQRLSETREEIGYIENKEKVREELSKILKIEKPPPPYELFIKVNPLPEVEKIYDNLVELAKESFKLYPENATEILKYVS